jgi:hypothetical protein
MCLPLSASIGLRRKPKHTKPRIDAAYKWCVTEANELRYSDPADLDVEVEDHRCSGDARKTPSPILTYKAGPGSPNWQS